MESVGDHQVFRIRRQRLPDQLVRMEVTEPVGARGVDVVHPEFHGAAQHRDGRLGIAVAISAVGMRPIARR